MMIFLQNYLQNSRGNPMYGHSGGKIPKFLPKMSPKYRYYAKYPNTYF